MVRKLRDDSRTTWGLPRFSRRENGTVPFPNGEVVFESSLSAFGISASGVDAVVRQGVGSNDRGKCERMATADCYT